MCMCSLGRRITLPPLSRILAEGFMQASLGFSSLSFSLSVCVLVLLESLFTFTFGFELLFSEKSLKAK